jgi:hypothetical protein
MVATISDGIVDTSAYSAIISSCTTGNMCSFIGDYKFVGTDEYIQIILVGFETDEYKGIFAGLGLAQMNI